MGKKIKVILKRLFKFVGLIVLFSFIVINVFIVLSGRFYLYKGIANTYLIGKTGPGIYDLDVFPYATLKKAKKPFKWVLTDKYNTYSLTKSEQKMHKETKSAAFLVFKGNELRFEKYWENHKEGTVSNSFSAAKTVVALLIGAAIDEGKIRSIDQKVADFIPAFRSDDKKDISIRHLMQMASGLDWEESGKNPLSENAESYYGTDLYGLVTRQMGISKPGVKFNYQSGNSQLLAFVLEKATDRTIAEYAQEKLWSKIGTQSDAFWSLEKENGAAKAFCCLYSTARDYGRLGKLIASYGDWNGVQIIDSTFMHELTTDRAPLTKDGLKNTSYAQHIWTYNDGEDDIFYCRGILGQYVVTIPSKGIVFVRLGHERMTGLKYEDYRTAKRFGENINPNLIDQPKDVLEHIKTAKRIASF